jgi:hypothetical protein
MERNENGAYLLDPVAVAKEVVDGYTRYNGGWIKTIEQIDKSKTNGYSLVGEFCKSGLQWMSPGVYLDCSIGGSRKNQRYVYTVFALREDGATVAYNDDAITVWGRGGDWAVRLWPVIERALGEVGGTDERAALLARRAELVAELERIDEQIRAMEERE